MKRLTALTLTAILLTFLPTTAQVPIGGDDMWPQWSPDSQYIAFNSNRDGNREVYVTDVLGGSVRNVTNMSSDEFLIGWLPDGERLAFNSNSGGRFQVFIVDGDGSDKRPLFPEAGGYGSITWSPDSRYVAYRLEDSQYIMEIESGEVWQVSRDDSFVTGAGTKWSPDGQWLAFHGFNPSSKEEIISVARVDGRDFLTFSVLTGRCCRLVWAWSPNSSEIVYGALSFPNLYSIDIATGTTQKVSSIGYVQTLHWLPNQKSLIVMADANQNGYLRTIYEVNVTDGGLRTIIQEDNLLMLPSPVGQHFAIIDQQKAFAVRLMGTDGTLIRGYNLPYDNAFGMVWSPDGKRLAMSLCLEGDADIYLISVDTEDVVNLTSEDTYTGSEELQSECLPRG
jgi:Tol biopolymer transport system component